MRSRVSMPHLARTSGSSIGSAPASPTRLRSTRNDDINPVWSPNGDRIAFTTFRNGNADVYVKNANGLGEETPLLNSPGNEFVEDWSKDGKYLAFKLGADAFEDIYVLPLSGAAAKPIPVVTGPYRKDEPQFSDDGKWLAYTSNESGTFEVYVVSFPAPEQKVACQPLVAAGSHDGAATERSCITARPMAPPWSSISKSGRGSNRVWRAGCSPRTPAPTSREPSRHQWSRHALTGNAFSFDIPMRAHRRSAAQEPDAQHGAIPRAGAERVPTDERAGAGRRDQRAHRDSQLACRGRKDRPMSGSQLPPPPRPPRRLATRRLRDRRGSGRRRHG